jgi:hypothetical protein
MNSEQNFVLSVGTENRVDFQRRCATLRMRVSRNDLEEADPEKWMRLGFVALVIVGIVSTIVIIFILVAKLNTTH